MVDKTRIKFIYSFSKRIKRKNVEYVGKFTDRKSGRTGWKYVVVNPRNGESLNLKIYKDSKYCFLDGSWRRWYFGKNQSYLADLNREQFKEVLFFLSRILGVKPGALWSAEIRYLELGFNTKLDREHELFINSFKRYGKLQRKNFDCETTEFIGSKKSLIFYDKCTQLKEVLKRKQRRKIKDKFLFLRSELKIRSKSGTKYIKKLGNVYDIYRNWSWFLDELFNIVKNKVEKIDLFSEDLDLTNSNLNWAEQRDLLVFQGIKLVGFDNALSLIENRSKHKSKISISRQKLFQIYHAHKSNNKQFLINDIYSRMQEKLSRLRT